MTGRDDVEHRPAVPLYITGEHPCSYLAGPKARTVFLDPLAPLSTEVYERLLDQGFRRSGTHVYRPACDPCHRCVSLRIPVADFAPNRSQRRNRTRNANDTQLKIRPALFDQEHYALYRVYLRSRHPEGTMADSSPESYRNFLIEPWGGETQLFELRLGKRLMAVAVTDVLSHSLSAVYTFFDPGLTDRAPGTYAVLRQIAESRRRGLDHLYLGYWLEECPKMSYKERYRPLEAWIGERWRRFERGHPISWHNDSPRAG